MKKILSLVVLACSSIFAQHMELNCIPGEQKCTTSPCVTIIFNNKTERDVRVDGFLEASLTGAARFLDNKFEFSRNFIQGTTSCHVPTTGLGKITKSASVTLKTPEGSCNIFLPKSAVSSSNTYHAVIHGGHCVITN